MSHVIIPLKNGVYRVEISLENAALATFERFDLPMRSGTLQRHQSELTAGTAAAIQSVLTSEEGVLIGTPVQLEADPIKPAAPGAITDRVDVAPKVSVRGAPVGDYVTRFWFYPQPDAGADNTIRATFHFKRD